MRASRHHHVIQWNSRASIQLDTDPKQGAESRVGVFEMLSPSRIPSITYHFVWPGIGHIAKQGSGYRYFPTPMQMAL